MKTTRIYIALPVMDESLMLPLVIEAIEKQNFRNFQLFICVNQPDEWWEGDATQQQVCHSNNESLAYIRSLKNPLITLIDKASKGNGWKGKKHGIGWARKTLMDAIAEVANDEDLIMSLDADTLFSQDYLGSVYRNFETCPQAVALSVPYFHRLTGNDEIDRAMLRYEIYMRSYAINLWRIGSQYSFTALGSAIVLPVRAYKAIGGLTPKLSGEDFYFLQKLVKYGPVMHWNSEMVYPAARLSARVFFGTGPALLKGIGGDWDSYPVYHPQLFLEIAQTCQLFPQLYNQDVPTPMDEFLLGLDGELPWAALRKNARLPDRFVRACHEKIDGLRILQYLKNRNKEAVWSDESSLASLMEILEIQDQPTGTGGALDFSTSSVTRLDGIRNRLAFIESDFRKKHHDHFLAGESASKREAVKQQH